MDERMSWTHPNLGEVHETVCPLHRGEVLAALRTLGIGCTGSLEPDGRTCDRCFHDGYPAREWLRQMYPKARA